MFRLHSARQRDDAKAGQADIYQYETASSKLRVQLQQILSKGFGVESAHYGGRVRNNWGSVEAFDILCRELGLHNLGRPKDSKHINVIYSVLSCEFERLIDTIEVSLHVISNNTSSSFRDVFKALEPSVIIDEVNFRLKDDNLGYQFENGLIVRVDSQFLHSEAVKPALGLISRPGFEGVQQEFIGAFDHYRAGRGKESIVDAAKAFESMMKAVCDQKGWSYANGDRATDLLKILRQNHLWPDYLDKSFDQLLATLASGLPQVRNDDAAHGQGANPREVPMYVASYALHLMASKIVLISEAASA